MNVGDRLNHYEIIGPIGAGGMGEVYSAHDTKLDRRVAIKLLPEDLAADDERRERFEREAKAIAALNHGNIVTIYSVEDAEGPAGDPSPGAAAGASLHFLTMELVEGKTLAEIIPADGLGLETFFDIAIPLADALSAAHLRGIAHRDLKPSNVMVTDDGKVKLLDFGLAKLFDEPGDDSDGRAGAGASADRMVTEQATVAGGAELGGAGGGGAGRPADLTEEGKVLGTVAYMSPEQAEGKPTDHRSDVFSLGIILYEMATGKRPFEGDTKLSVMSSIVKDQPASLIEVNTELPRHLGRIVKRALEKNVDRRFQTALDLRNEIEDLRNEIESGELLVTGATAPFGDAAHAAGGRGRGLALPLSIGALAIAGVVIGWMALDGRSGDEAGPALRVTTRGIAISPAPEFGPAVSPDGQWIVFATIPDGPPPEGLPPEATKPPDLFLKNVDGQTTINLTNTPLVGEFDARYSPDGSRIAYWRGGLLGSGSAESGIYVMGATGENPRRLSARNASPTWSPDGTKIYVAEIGFGDPRSIGGASQIRSIDVASGEETMVFGHDGWSALQPSVSPDGERIAFWGLRPGGGQRDIFTFPIAGGDPVAVTNDPAVDWSPLFSPDGRYLYFSSDRGGSMNIWRIPIDPATGEAAGEPEALTGGGLGDQGYLSISADGSRLAYAEVLRRSYVERASFDPETLTVADDGVQLSGPVRVVLLTPSFDGRRLAYNSFGSRQDLYVVNVDGTDERQLTDDIDKDWRPQWLNDGETLVFYSDTGGAYDVWKIRSDGSGRAKIAATAGDESMAVVSPDGRYVAVSQRDVDVTSMLEIGDDPASVAITTLPSPSDASGRMTPRHWSPDGRWVVGLETGPSLAIFAYNVETAEYRRLADVGGSPRFTPDGAHVLYDRHANRPSSDWWLIDIETLEERRVNLPQTNIGELWLLPDGETAVYIEFLEAEWDVWMLEIEEGAR